MALTLETVTNSIAALVVTGVKMCDIDEIPSPADMDRTPHFYPEPGGFVNSLTVTRDSFGAPSCADKHVTYTLRYVFAYQPSGSERALKDQYPLMVGLALDILDALIANDDLTGAIDMTPSGAGGWGLVMAPDGRYFCGCIINLTVMEFIN